jgi:lambda repressor-like predicted transcriptional regulator
MTPLEIQFELRKRDILQKLIALEEGKSEMAVSKVINKSMVSNQLMRAVAQKIDKKPSEVFPEYYQAKPKRSNVA